MAGNAAGTDLANIGQVLVKSDWRDNEPQYPFQLILGGDTMIGSRLTKMTDLAMSVYMSSTAGFCLGLMAYLPGRENSTLDQGGDA
jgi:hypothetical protein